jgi:biotin carboxyl carrier protein
MRYFVTIQGRTLQVDLSGETPTLDGRPVEARLTTVPGSDVRHLLLGSRSHSVVARQSGRKGIWNLTIGGRTVAVEVLDERTRTIRQMAGGGEAEADKAIYAPMPGMVVRINVEVGDTVAAGQGIVVVEAMKMENELKAPSAGVVARIEAAPGKPVEKGAVLIVLE